MDIRTGVPEVLLRLAVDIFFSSIKGLNNHAVWIS
jgi:hypothetical protein